MVNKTLVGITTALHNAFGDSYHYYVENVKQHLTTPCFTADVLNPIKRSVNDKHYYCIVPCVIHYFTDDKINSKADCYSIGEQTLECLEYINIDGQVVRGEEMSYSLVDDVLQIFITYRFWTAKVVQIPDDMEGVEINNPSVN